MVGQTSHAKLSRPLKSAAISIFDLQPKTLKFLNEDSDMESGFLLGSTYREVQIEIFKMLSVRYGPSVLARLFIRYAKKNIASKHIVISDCGKTVEAQALVEHFGKSGVALIVLNRDGYDFSNDIREYVDINCDKKATIDNDYDLELFKAQVRRVLIKWRLVDGDN